jgi:hypothetical protein
MYEILLSPENNMEDAPEKPPRQKFFEFLPPL